MRQLLASMALVAVLATGGCLQRETTSTVYLHPDGSFDWIVIEHDVRSDEDVPARRLEEERGYVERVTTATSGVAASLAALGGRDIRVRLIRDTPPYAAMMEARFDSLSGLFERELAACGLPFETAITRENDVTTWRLRLDIGPEQERLQQGEGCGGGFAGLSEALDPVILLESGAFTKAVGFTFEGATTARIDRRVIGSEALEKAGGRIELSLSWQSR